MGLIEPQAAPIKAAVLFESVDFREPLRAALAAAGASIAAEFKISEFSAADLDELEASVLLVNLEPALGSRPELLEALVAGRFAGDIVFNDAEATAQLTGPDMARWARSLASKVMGGTGLPRAPERSVPAEPIPAAQGGHEGELWLLGASIGGPEAVRVFLSGLSEDLPFAFILAQHIGEEFMELMASQLDQVSPFPVRVAEHGDRLRPGSLLVVPAGRRLTITRQSRIHLEDQHPGSSYSPCIDQVFVDAADRFGADTHAIVFSGMSSDGVAGASRIVELGGEVWVQSPETCVVSSIVEGALKTGGVSFVGTPQELATRMNQRAAEIVRSASA